MMEKQTLIQIGGLVKKYYIRYYCSSDAATGKLTTYTGAPSDAIKDLGMPCGFSCSSGK